MEKNVLDQLTMGVFTPEDQLAIEQIYQKIDLDNDLFVSEFGALSSLMNTHKSIEEASERTYLTALANQLSMIVDQMNLIERSHAPQRVPVFKRLFLSLTGPYELEQRIQARQASMSFGEILEKAKQDAKQVKARIGLIDAMLRDHHGEVQLIRNHIAAGRLYLEHNPTAGVPNDADMTFTNARERFARRLANLSALLASHEMSFVQMKLTKAQSIDLCDRFTEVSEVLVPIWAHYQNTLKSGDQKDPEALATANKVHEALVQSLTKSVTNLSTTETRH